jgi:hypothetical protein
MGGIYIDRYDKIAWFHGSPIILDELLEGSTITHDMEIARLFSHKPSLVANDEHGAFLHNGILNGYLYIIDEPVSPDDVYPHPNTTMEPGVEWLIRRPLKVRKISETKPDPTELLSDEDVSILMRQFRMD